MWIDRDDLPEDAADWKDLEIDLERLADDSPESCPISVEEVFEYVQMESADLDDADRKRLTFIRTAKIALSGFWLWEYIEGDGDEAYVVYAESRNGPVLGLSSKNGLSPEQYLLAEHFDEVYWS